MKKNTAITLTREEVLEEQKKIWMSEVTDCDLCRKPFGKYFYDAAIGPEGQWGLVCEKCFTFNGGELGIGKGQKYVTKTKIGVAGFNE